MFKSRKKEFTWLNPYIKLAKELPDRLILAREQELSNEQFQIIKDSMQSCTDVVIEPGSGSGAHIIELARRNPSTFFIGFELRFKRAYKTIIKADREGIKNLLVVIGDAKHALQLFDDCSLTGCYVNFPDPWAKRRWNKHRMLDTQFLRQLARVLKPNGFLKYKTDHGEYFAKVVDELNKSAEFTVTDSTQNLYADEPRMIENIPTEFERLFHFQTLPIFYLSAVKS